MTIPVLVTLAQFSAHLKIPPPVGSPLSAEAHDLQQKLDTATQLVCEHIADRQPADPAWIAEIEGWGPTSPPPPLVVLAILELGSYVVRYLGDDGPEQPMTPGYLPTPVLNLLVRYHWGAVA